MAVESDSAGRLPAGFPLMPGQGTWEHGQLPWAREDCRESQPERAFGLKNGGFISTAGRSQPVAHPKPSRITLQANTQG